MYLNDLVPDHVYAVILNYGEREISFMTGTQLALCWETSPRVQKFLWEAVAPIGYQAVACDERQSRYILVRECPGLKVHETLRLFRRLFDLSPITTYLREV